MKKKILPIILMLSMIALMVLGFAAEVKGQNIVFPENTLEVSVQDTLTYGVTDTESTVISATYFRFTYDPEVLSIIDVYSNLDEWYIVGNNDVPGVLEVATLTPTVRAFDGDFFSLVVIPISAGSSQLTLTDVSWTDCNNITVIPPRPDRPTNPSPEEVAAFYTGITYWIDPVYGNDMSSDCSLYETPCRSVAPIRFSLNPGDAVVFSEGVHRVKIKPARSGTVGQPITYTSYPGQNAIISGSDIFTNTWNQNGDGTWTATYTTSLPQHPAFAKPQVQWRPEMLIMEGMVFSTVYDRGDVITETFYIEGSSTSPSSVTAGFPTDPNTVQIEMAARDTLFVPESAVDYINVTGLTFVHAGNSLGKLGCFEVNGNGWFIFEVLVEECNTTGIKFYGDDHHFSDVHSNYNGTVGWNAENSYDVLIEDSYAIGNNTKGFLPNWHAGGGKFTHGTSRLTLIRVEFHDNNGPGVWFDIPWGVYNRILDSKFINNQMAGIFLEHGTIYTSVDNNVVYGTRKYNGVGAGIRIQAASDNSITYNTIYGNMGSGLFEKYKDKRSPAGHNHFSNNIFGYNAVDSSSDYEIRIDQDPNERIVDHFSDNLIVLQDGLDITFRIENGYTGDSIDQWLESQLHVAPFDITMNSSQQILENPLSPSGYRSLIEGYGASFSTDN